MWDMHRHRLPPELIQRIDALRKAQRLHVHAGRCSDSRTATRRIEVDMAPARHADQSARRRSIGSSIAPAPTMRSRVRREPLWRNLVQCGLCVPDPLGLGLRTGPHGAVIDADGWPGPHLFYVGPMLRADLWEATAASELACAC